MKNAGTPAIEDDNDSGSGGVNAEGFGARLPRRGLAVVPPFVVEPPAPLPSALPLVPPRARLGRPAGVAPWALWLLTCGTAVTGSGAVVVAGAGVVSVGVDGDGVVVGVDGAGVELVGACAGGALVVVSVLAGVVASSAASELAGPSAASVSANATRGRKIATRRFIAQLPRR